MSITSLQTKILVLLANDKRECPVSHASFPDEQPFIVDGAIKQLHNLGYVVALTSSADDIVEGFWLADVLTPEGKMYLTENSLY